MLLPIQLYPQSQFWAVKINHIRPNTKLSAKFYIFHLSRFQHSPHSSFCACTTSSQLTPQNFLLCSINQEVSIFMWKTILHSILPNPLRPSCSSPYEQGDKFTFFAPLFIGELSAMLTEGFPFFSAPLRGAVSPLTEPSYLISLPCSALPSNGNKPNSSASIRSVTWRKSSGLLPNLIVSPSIISNLPL